MIDRMAATQIEHQHMDTPMENATLHQTSRYVENHMRDSLKDHLLIKIADAPCDGGLYKPDSRIVVYRLQSPKRSRVMSTLLTFNPEGIVLQGDLTPRRHGIVSAIGYGLGWFASQLGESYLCEKFLRETWVQEIAIRELKDPDCYLREDATDDQIKELDRIANELEYHDGEWLYQEISDLFGYAESIPGTGYDPAEAGWLCAIQQRFCELYSAA